MSPFRHEPEVRSLAWEYPAGHRIESHAHDHHQLLFASRGVMVVRAAGGRWVVPPQRAVWVPGGMQHAIEASGPVSMRTLYFAPRLRRPRLRECRALAVGPLLRELILHAVERGTLGRASAPEARLIGVLLDQLALVPDSALFLPEPRDRRALRVAEKVLAAPGERRPLDELARGSGASARTIERLFVAETGTSFGRWCQQVRLAHALPLVASGRAVTKVALEVGYESPSATLVTARPEATSGGAGARRTC